MATSSSQRTEDSDDGSSNSSDGSNNDGSRSRRLKFADIDSGRGTVFKQGVVVWVQMGGLWWPGVTYKPDQMPPKFVDPNSKPPLRYIKFFQGNEL